MTRTDYQRPQIGDVTVEIRSCEDGTFWVYVQTYKANTLRGDAYWVSVAARSYRKRSDAERFASRFI